MPASQPENMTLQIQIDSFFVGAPAPALGTYKVRVIHRQSSVALRRFGQVVRAMCKCPNHSLLLESSDPLMGLFFVVVKVGGPLII